MPHRFTFEVGESAASVDLPALPSGHVAMVLVPFIGPDPTPVDCH